MSNRNNGTTCSICSNRVVAIGINDLVTTHPHFAKQWNYDKNEGYTPEMFVSGSNYLAWWKCDKCGHEWQTKIATRTITSKNGECPICAKAVKLETYYQTLTNNRGSLNDSDFECLLDWDYAKNIDIDIGNLTIGSSKNVWWKCHICSHEWMSPVYTRTSGHGCPECARLNNVSSLQNKICEYIFDKYGVIMNHEYNCELICRNPKTKMILPYDNELIHNKCRLIIECNGRQHYEICGFTYLAAKEKDITPEQALKDQQYRDNLKRDYAISQGYYYLAVPYWTESDDSYKNLIDEMFHKIFTQQND